MGRRKLLVWSAICAVVFLIISYWVTNLRFPISGEKELLTKFEAMRSSIMGAKQSVPDSVVLINVSYDRELVPYCKNGIPLGRLAITDRRKLLSLLSWLAEHDNYRYILLDVFFEDGLCTESDSLLFETILSMPRVIIPYHSDECLADERLLQKAGLADYYVTTSESDFVKYPYLYWNEKSLPLRMYEEIAKRRVNDYGVVCLEGWCPVRRSIVLVQDLVIGNNFSYGNDKPWYDLGQDLLGDTIQELQMTGSRLIDEIPDLFRDKYVVIGSFSDDDIHSTYLGDVPGVVINMNAFLSLLQGHHRVSLSLTLILLFVFFVLSYLTLARQQLQDVLKSMGQAVGTNREKHLFRLLSVICSWIGYSTLLTIICAFTYFFLGEAYDILVTSTLFTVFKYAVAYLPLIRKKSKYERKIPKALLP